MSLSCGDFIHWFLNRPTSSKGKSREDWSCYAMANFFLSKRYPSFSLFDFVLLKTSALLQPSLLIVWTRKNFCGVESNMSPLIALKRSEVPALFWNDPIFHSLSFKVAVDTCGLRIGSVLSQQGYPIEYFGEKVNNLRQNWSTYEQELYAWALSIISFPRLSFYWLTISHWITHSLKMISTVYMWGGFFYLKI